MDRHESGPQPEEAADMQALLETSQDDILLIDIGGKKLLVCARDVSEVVRPLPLTPVPMGPGHLLGLGNVRGQIVCMIDASKIMSLPPRKQEITSQTRFLILRHPKMHVGIWVDAIDALFRVNTDQVPEPAQAEAREAVCGRMEVAGKEYDMLNCAGLFQ